jgi:hypothetical protein
MAAPSGAVWVHARPEGGVYGTNPDPVCAACTVSQHTVGARINVRERGGRRSPATRARQVTVLTCSPRARRPARNAFACGKIGSRARLVYRRSRTARGDLEQPVVVGSALSARRFVTSVLGRSTHPPLTPAPSLDERIDRDFDGSKIGRQKVVSHEPGGHPGMLRAEARLSSTAPPGVVGLTKPVEVVLGPRPARAR